MHLDGPGATNIYTSAVGQEVLWAVLLLCITPMLIEANKLIGDDTGMRPIPFPEDRLPLPLPEKKMLRMSSSERLAR